MIASGDARRLLEARDQLLEDGQEVRLLLAALFDALANDDLEAAQDIAAEYARRLAYRQR